MDTDREELLRAMGRHVREKIAHDLETEDAAAVALRADMLARAREGIARARARGLCGRAWLFGSFAWGKPGERSDVDLLIADANDPDLVGVIVSRACGGRDVHVVQHERAAAELIARATTDGLAL